MRASRTQENSSAIRIRADTDTLQRYYTWGSAMRWQPAIIIAGASIRLLGNRNFLFCLDTLPTRIIFSLARGDSASRLPFLGATKRPNPAPVRYDPAARCPAWDRFNSEVFPLAQALASALGLALLDKDTI